MISRRTQAATLGVGAWLLMVCGGVTGVTLAEAHTYGLASATSTCASRPAASIRVVSLVRPNAPAASASPTPSSVPNATKTPTPTADVTPTPTPKPTKTPASSGSPSPTTKTSSPTPTPHKTSPTPSPTQSKKPTPKPTATPKPKLCVLVQPFSSNSVRPGQTAGYAIWVWSTVAEAKGVSVTVTLGSVAHVDAPRFTVCAKSNRDSCTVGTLPTGQSEELVAGAFVRRAAVAGERITLTATVQASKAVSFHSAATINVVAPSASPSPDPSLPTSTVPPGSGPSGYTSPNGDPGGLFPTVSPSGSHPARGHSSKALNRSNARDVSSTLPLDGRLIGGQIAGLAILATAIAIAIARLSLRGARAHDARDAAK